MRDLRVYYHTSLGAVRAVDGVSFNLRTGERLGLVGESGSGKSTVAMALMRLIKPPGRIESGQALFEGADLLALPEQEMRRLRLAAIALVAQGAMNSLNPVTRVRRQFADALRDHGQGLTRSALDARIRELLSTVGLGPEVADKYPHELSGGMKQRVVIAIAISLRARVIIADEPTSAPRRRGATASRRDPAARPGKNRRLDPARRPRHGVDGPGRRPVRGHVRGHACRSLRPR